METIHHINLKPLAEVNKWDTKRVLAYKDRIQKHISFLENGMHTDEHGNREPIDEAALQKFVNYKEQLKNILSTRENIK